MGQDLADRIRVTSLERHQRRVDDALVFAGEFFADQFFELLDIEAENFRDETEDEDVFAFVFGGAAERFDRQSGNGHADINETFVVEVWLNVVRIVKQHAAFFQEIEMVLVTVLIKRD